MYKDLSNRPKTREIEDLQKIPAYFLEVKRGPWERGCCERRRISGCRLSTLAEIRLRSQVTVAICRQRRARS